MCSGAGTAPAAPAGTDGCSATAASRSGCPRLTGGAVGLKDPIRDCRSDDLTAIDSGTGERQEARKLKSCRALHRLCPSGGNAGPDMGPECELPTPRETLTPCAAAVA